MPKHPESHELPLAPGPHAHIAQLRNGHWRYRWWDDGVAYLQGESPTREETKPALQIILPMLLADHARAQLQAELRNPPQT